MKLAEALLLRADIQKKLASLRERIVANAVVQEGVQPHEDPNELLMAAFGAAVDLEELITKVNAANLATKLPDGRSLTAAIAHRDTLKTKHAILVAAIAGSRKEPERYSTREIKWLATMEVAKMQKQADDIAKQLRELDGRIQETNWQAEIAD